MGFELPGHSGEDRVGLAPTSRFCTAVASVTADHKAVQRDVSGASRGSEPSTVSQLDEPAGGLADHRTGREDHVGAARAQLVKVGGRDHAADDDEDVGPAPGVQCGPQLRHQGQVAGRQRARAGEVRVNGMLPSPTSLW